MIDPALPPKAVGVQDGPTYRVGNDVVTFKAMAADTNGAYSLFETRTDPGEGTPAHRQRFDDEAFWVLDGSYTVLLDQDTVTLDAGAFAFVPRGTIHAYINRGDEPARMLILVTPGGIHERFFAEVGELVEDRSAPATTGGPSDLSRLANIAQKYGIEILPIMFSSP